MGRWKERWDDGDDEDNDDDDDGDNEDDNLSQMEKESEECMATDQETIRLLFYIVRLRELVGIWNN